MAQSERPGGVSAFRRLTGLLSGRNSLGLGGRYSSHSSSYGTFVDSDDVEVERGSIGYFIARITNNDQNRLSYLRVIYTKMIITHWQIKRLWLLRFSNFLYSFKKITFFHSLLYLLFPKFDYQSLSDPKD